MGQSPTSAAHRNRAESTAPERSSVRGRAIAVAVLFGLAAASGFACWWNLAASDHEHHQEVSVVGLFRYLLMWSTMMAAMMLPTVHRTTFFYARALRTESPSRLRTTVRLAALLLGYLLIWSIVGVPVYLVGAIAGLWVTGEPHALASLTALGLASAGVFQFSSLKERCLHECQSPLGFVVQHMARTGWDRDLRAGLAHGLTCVGCCAAMVVILVVLGTMSAPAMVTLGVIAMVEKTWAKGPTFSRAAGLAMVVAAALVVMNPHWAASSFGAGGAEDPGPAEHEHHRHQH